MRIGCGLYFCVRRESRVGLVQNRYDPTYYFFILYFLEFEKERANDTVFSTLSHSSDRTVRYTPCTVHNLNCLLEASEVNKTGFGDKYRKDKFKGTNRCVCSLFLFRLR